MNMLDFFRERARSKSVSARNLEHSINDHEQELCEVICCTGLPSILLNVLVELCNPPFALQRVDPKQKHSLIRQASFWITTRQKWQLGTTTKLRKTGTDYPEKRYSIPLKDVIINFAISLIHVMRITAAHRKFQLWKFH